MRSPQLCAVELGGVLGQRGKESLQVGDFGVHEDDFFMGREQTYAVYNRFRFYTDWQC